MNTKKSPRKLFKTPIYERARKLRGLRAEMFAELLKAQFEKAGVWCERLAQMYPDELVSYTCQLKLFFMGNDREHFFEVLNKLKKSDVIIDNETLELIRVFS